MRELPGAEVFEVHDDVFLRHHADPRATRRAWTSGRAVVVDGSRGRPDEVPTAPVFTCLGPPEDLDPLLAEVAAIVEPPGRVSVEVTSYAALPDAWRPAEHHRWHWMMTRTATAAPHLPVEEVGSAAEVDAVLDAANPGSFARPGTPGVETWLGVRESGRLVAVGALIRQHDGTGHLRGVSVLPSYAGGGRGRAVSAALTRLALAGGSGVATLGVYTDNAPAIAVYRRLGYTAAHTFASGATPQPGQSPRPSTTAVAPSR